MSAVAVDAVRSAQVSPASSDRSGSGPRPSWEFKVLIDNACPLCRHEGRLLLKLDKGRGRIALEDIADPAFIPATYGKTMDELMGSIHGVLPDGSLVHGVEVFRRAYGAVGLGWLLAWTRWPIARPIADAAYRVFARIRLHLPGRTECAGGMCKLPT
jgi:predicted DCC family thiol-disulfide oxidoreductase YuxK